MEAGAEMLRRRARHRRLAELDALLRELKVSPGSGRRSQRRPIDVEPRPVG